METDYCALPNYILKLETTELVEKLNLYGNIKPSKIVSQITPKKIGIL